MKTLFLMRHAKSDWSDSAQSDFDRPLNKRGRSDAPRMAALLNSDGGLADSVALVHAVAVEQFFELFKHTKARILEVVGIDSV